MRDSEQAYTDTGVLPALFDSALTPTCRIWDRWSCECKAVPKGHCDCVTSLTISPDGRTVVSVSEDGTVRWDDLELCGSRAVFCHVVLCWGS